MAGSDWMEERNVIFEKRKKMPLYHYSLGILAKLSLDFFLAHFVSFVSAFNNYQQSLSKPSMVVTQIGDFHSFPCPPLEALQSCPSPIAVYLKLSILPP